MAGSSAAIPAGQTRDVQINFSRILTEIPRVLHALRTINVDPLSTNNPRISSRLSELSLQGCKITFDAPSPVSNVYGIFLTLPKNDIHFETGMFNTAVLEKRIFFAREFDAPPIVRCWIQAFDATSPNVGS